MRTSMLCLTLALFFTGTNHLHSNTTNPPNPVFNNVHFEYLMHEQFAGKVKGYSFVVVDKDGIRSKASGGWAQTPNNGNVKMKTHVASCLGSVSKMLSSIALLHLFDRHKLSNATVQDQLDTKIWHKFPPKWHSEIHANSKKITYRQLLQHKSGIRQKENSDHMQNRCKGMMTFCVFKDAIYSDNIGEREYSNFNIRALTVLIPAIAYPNRCRRLHDQHKHLSVEAYTKKLLPEYKKMYIEYMKEVIFPKSLGNIRPTCDVRGELASNKYAKGYNNKNSNSGSIIEGCAAQGSWYMTAQELANFARTFAFTNRYIGPTTRNNLLFPSPKDDRIAFNKYVESSAFYSETRQRKWLYHGGTQGGYRAALIQLPFGYFAVGMINSKDRESWDLAEAMFANFREATRGEPIYLSQHGQEEYKYDRIAKDLGDLGSESRWADFYEVNGQLFTNYIFKPDNNKLGTARHGMTASQYQAFIDQFWPQGYRPIHVDSYKKGSSVRYSAILERNNRDYAAQHDLSSQEFLAVKADMRNRGYIPMDVSAVSVGNNRKYTCTWKKNNGTDWDMKVYIKSSELEGVVNTMLNRDLVPTRITAFRHDGQDCFSAIFKGTGKDYAYIYGVSYAAYQAEYNKRIQQGYALKSVTGYASGNTHKFAGVWLK